MKKLLMGLLLTPLLAGAQKVTKDIRPDTHELWLVTDEVDLNFRIVSLNSIIGAHFRTEGPKIFLYMSGAGQLSPHDYAYFITDGDTITVHSTGTQPGGWDGKNPYHEYSMTKEDLSYLATHPVKQVVVSHYAGWDVTNVPAKDQGRLEPYCAAVLKNMLPE